MEVPDLERRLYTKIRELRLAYHAGVPHLGEATIHLHPLDHEDVELHHDPYRLPQSKWENGEFVTRVRGIRTAADPTVRPGEAHLCLRGTRLAL